MIVSGLFSFFFGCRENAVTKEALIGVWECETQNNIDLKKRGFNSVKWTFTDDSVEVVSDMNQFGGHITAKSKGSWHLEKGRLRTKFGDEEHVSEIRFQDNLLIFTPDALFRPETVRISTFRKVK